MTRRVRRNSDEGPALGALEALYREVDAAYAGWSCPASTECCRFGVTGREPYVTSIELAMIRKAVAARGGRAAPRPKTKSLPMADERPCPLLSAEGRCTIYAARPLGCRTFFCERADSSQGDRVGRSDVAEFVRKVQEIAAKHEVDGDRGRPLTRAF